ncbi:uncharacterized protein LOC119670261 [Teleopsis dalmanni]|uniref:uncharacterized protein LOC119670261 n=1 Tax=Teleopsis dalmanni TaxID=139649 RepID=UPI0018CCE52C|nr:uncharacterized protein LOC119670261 [Teleopsis dalmanni]
MRTCFVPGCDKKCKQMKRTMFKVPKEKQLFEKWIHSLPKVKPLTEADRVCSLHFHTDDVQNTFYHIIEGKTLHIPRERPRLKLNAVPTLNIPSENELEKFKYAPRKHLKNTKNFVNDKSFTSNKSNNSLKTSKDNLDITNSKNKELSPQSVNSPITDNKHPYAAIPTQKKINSRENSREKDFTYNAINNKPEIVNVEYLISYQATNIPKESAKKDDIFSETDLKNQSEKVTLESYANDNDVEALQLSEAIIKPKKFKKSHSINSCSEELNRQTTKVPFTAYKDDKASMEFSPEASKSYNDQYQSFFDDIYEVELPNTLWGIHRCPERSIIIFSYMDIKQMSPTKMISIDTEGIIKIFSNKQLMNTTSLLNEDNNIQRVSKLLLELDQLN